MCNFFSGKTAEVRNCEDALDQGSQKQSCKALALLADETGCMSIKSDKGEGTMCCCDGDR